MGKQNSVNVNNPKRLTLNKQLAHEAKARVEKKQGKFTGKAVVEHKTKKPQLQASQTKPSHKEATDTPKLHSRKATQKTRINYVFINNRIVNGKLCKISQLASKSFEKVSNMRAQVSKSATDDTQAIQTQFDTLMANSSSMRKNAHKAASSLQTIYDAVVKEKGVDSKEAETLFKQLNQINVRLETAAASLSLKPNLEQVSKLTSEFEDIISSLEVLASEIPEDNKQKAQLKTLIKDLKTSSSTIKALAEAAHEILQDKGISDIEDIIKQGAEGLKQDLKNSRNQKLILAGVLVGIAAVAGVAALVAAFTVAAPGIVALSALGSGVLLGIATAGSILSPFYLINKCIGDISSINETLTDLNHSLFPQSSQ